MPISCLNYYIQAFNANSAIEVAKQNEKYEIARLQFELNALRQQYQDLLSENNKFKFRSPFGVNQQQNNINPLEVLGFKENPSKDELKKRYRLLAKKYHSDTGGSDFIMRMIQEAFDDLNKSA